MTLLPILIIEDDADIREVVAYALDKEGFPVRTAENGGRAFEVLRAHPTSPPGLIILDLMMHGMNGEQFLIEMQRHPNETWSKSPVVLSTASQRPSFPHFPSVVGFLRKPLNLSDLLDTAERYCGKPSAEER